VVVTYVNYMEDQYPDSNCVVHEDDVDWGGGVNFLVHEISYVSEGVLSSALHDAQAS